MASLVTGGAGYIGSHMVWTLLEAGETVIVLDRLSTGFASAISPDAKFYRGDIADTALLQTIFAEHNIEAIFHFAGSVVVPESVVDPLSYYDNNTLKSQILIAAAVSAGIKHFIFSSTAAVYGTPNGNEPVGEAAALRPESPYGRSKMMTELMLRDASSAYDLRYTALRYFNVAGADPSLRTGQSTVGATHLIKVACETATGQRDYMEVFGTDYPTKDGTCVRDFIHVSDLTAAHMAALIRLRSGGGSLVANCGYGRGFSVLEVIDCVKKVANSNLNIRFSGRRPGDAVSVIADPRLAFDELGWRPRYDSLEVIVQTALSWENHRSRRNDNSIGETERL